jgi:peptidyl-prolyl cis-trans isomerase A (cyclophilin A)
MTAAALVLATWTLSTLVPLQASPPPVVVVFETELGSFEIEVNVAQAPATAANFLKYVDGSFYDGGVFHRTVRPDTETNRTHPIQVIQARRAGGRQGFPAVALERTSMTKLKHLDGTVSMARAAGQPDSATSDFFICIGDQPALDEGGGRNADNQGFGAFGKVIGGMDVVRKIQAAQVQPGTQTLGPPIKILKAYRKTRV